MALAVAAVAVAIGAVSAFGAASDLDGSFSTDGKQTVDFGDQDRATHVAPAPGDKIVLIGSTDATGSGDFAVSRLNADGTPDTTFDGEGRKSIDSTQASSNDIGGGIVALDDGKIVVAGRGNLSKDFLVVKLNTDGTVDTSFIGGVSATPGRSIVSFGLDETVDDMIRQSDGKLVIVGGTNINDAGDFAILRLNADGSVDNTFSGDGKLTLNFGGNDEAVSVAQQSSGKIIVAGTGGAAGDMAVARLNTDGTLDTSFAAASSGLAKVDFGGAETVGGMAVQADDKVVISGSTSTSGGGDQAVARLNADGTIDNSFSSDGKVIFGTATTGETALGAVVQQSGRIIVNGNGGATHDFIVTRLSSDGTVDTTFGLGGLAINFGGFEYDGDIAIRPDGRILLAGSTDVSDDGDQAVARLVGDAVITPPPPDGQAPDTFIQSGVRNAYTSDSTPTFKIAATEPARFLCVVDRGPTQDCSATFTPAELGVGEHQIAFSAVDGANNIDPQAAFAEFSVAKAANAPECPADSSGRRSHAATIWVGTKYQNGKTVYATDGADRILGSHFYKDPQHPFAGDFYGDDIQALGGDDLICSNGGTDTIHAGPGNDKIGNGSFAAVTDTDPPEAIGADASLWYGEEGADQLSSAYGNDRLYGGEGRDYFFASYGRDRLFGGDGNDRMFGAGDADRLFGGDGRDYIEGNAGKDYIRGNVGADELRGDGQLSSGGAGGITTWYGSHLGFGSDPGRDDVRGDQGKDILVGGPLPDRLEGGPDRDRCDGEREDHPVRSCDAPYP